MKTNSKFITRQLFLILISSMIAINDVLADRNHNEARRLKEAGKIMPLEQIIIKARKLRSGHILEIELEHEHGRYIYELEILDDDGTIWELEYDAKNGELIKNKKEL